MSDFEQQRAAVARLRQQVEAQRIETLLAREAARRDQRNEPRFKRAAEQLDRLRGQLGEVLDVFQPFTDPSEQIANLSDEVPILLFPLRLETRFRPIGRGRHQLWVRFYPDSCLIDTFEASLTDQEAENARLFWQQHAAAAGDEALERDAWRELVASHGAGRAGWIIRQPLENIETRRTSWSSAARIDLLPERLVVVAYPAQGAGPPLTAVGRLIRTPLAASPDPNAAPAEALRQVDDELHIPTDIAWMFDFEKAEEVGMAMRIDLSPAQAAEGFERLIAIGVRMSDSPDEGRDHLTSLLRHHLHSREGLEIVPQGTPTNNTEQLAAGYSFRGDPDATFDIFVREREQYPPERDELLWRDGQWLAGVLTLPDDLVQRIPFAGGTDQSDARAMQIALWEATFGYLIRAELGPVFTPDTVDWTRHFFTRHVSGRGPIPALRIGRQPYGILPTAAFESLTWPKQDERMRRLHEILVRVEQEWTPLIAQVSHVGKEGGDPHQILLDVLGLHPTSVEYHRRMLESLDHKFNELSFHDFATARSLLAAFPSALPLALLRRFGYEGAEIPDLFTRIFRSRQTSLAGPLVDDRPLSETEPIRKYAGDQNYIEWLAAAARTGIDAVRAEQGFDGGKRPTALLYLLLRHAVQLGFHQTAVQLHAAARLPIDMAMAQREPAFVHVAAEARASESRYDLLFRVDPRVTAGSDLRIGDYIAQNATTVNPHLGEQIRALDRLARLPTAKLERLFAEHHDCCSYRLDAWRTGMLFAWLGRRRGHGLYLGAFGWVEHLRPKQSDMTPADLPADLEGPVNRRHTAALMRDSGNGGLIHAPSIGHATTAAVLRNGYMANDGRLAVNITSRRVRLALDVIAGMRNGQSLGALLGYQLERYIHDHGPLGVRDLIYHLRRKFPLAANQIQGNADNPAQPQESIAAMNVVDGRRLIEHVEGTSPPAIEYPFGIGELPRRGAAQEAVMTEALSHIRNINDAVADLVLTEGVHQAVMGNYERSAGVLDAFARGNSPPEPEVIRTPRTGVALTLRAAVHFPIAPDADPIPGIARTPLAIAEPSVNQWLRDRLPAPDVVGCNVVFTDRATNTEQTVFVSQRDLALHPIDLLHRVDASADQALGDVDDAIVRYVQANHAPRHDRPLTLRHSDRLDDRYTWFELQALLRSFRVLLGSRPLRAEDLVRNNDATDELADTSSLARERVQVPRDDLNDTLLPSLDDLRDTLEDEATTTDDAIAAFAAAMAPIAAYRLPHSATGFAYEWRATTYDAMATTLRARVERWDARLATFDRRLADYDALPGTATDAERLALLAAAELLVSTAMTTPRPEDPGEYRDDILPARRTAFVQKRDELAEVYTVARETLTQLVADANGVLPLTDFDVEDLDFVEVEGEVERFRIQLVSAVNALRADMVKRIAAVDALLAEHDAAGTSAEKVSLLQRAGAQLFGDGFQFIPQVELPAGVSAELMSAWTHSTTGKLTEHLTTERDRDFPVDDWLHGVARVRDNMRHWENVSLLGDAMRVAGASDLTPIQLPFDATDPWLALEFPDGHEITSDRLLYTAHFAAPYTAAQPLRGVLVDEWTEVIPDRRETTGIAFHYDRPNSEPPQCWLLALASTTQGSWSWDDLLAAVNDALDSAKLRALEPRHLDHTAYSWFLPATGSPFTYPEISISNNLLRNRDIYEVAGGPD